MEVGDAPRGACEWAKFDLWPARGPRLPVITGCGAGARAAPASGSVPSRMASGAAGRSPHPQPFRERPWATVSARERSAVQRECPRPPAMRRRWASTRSHAARQARLRPPRLHRYLPHHPPQHLTYDHDTVNPRTRTARPVLNMLKFATIKFGIRPKVSTKIRPRRGEYSAVN